MGSEVLGLGYTVKWMLSRVEDLPGSFIEAEGPRPVLEKQLPRAVLKKQLSECLLRGGGGVLYQQPTGPNPLDHRYDLVDRPRTMGV